MRFEVYCDESNSDVFTSNSPKAKHLMIGGLWLPASLRDEIKSEIGRLRERYGVYGEIKWTKVSPSSLDFYLSLIDLYFSRGDEFRFRCIAVDKDQVNMALHDGDGELGFYKFYYQMLHHWVLDFNEYAIFCDSKTNRDPHRLGVLKSCLSSSNLSSRILSVQSLPSKEVVLIQFCDLLLGAASSRVNSRLREGSAKEKLVHRIEARLGRCIAPTAKDEEKFNVFKIRLQGGW